MFKCLRNRQTLFQRGCIVSYSSQAVYENSTSFVTFVVVHSTRCVVVPHCGLTYISMITDEARQLSMYLLANIHSWNVCVQISYKFLNWVAFLPLNSKSYIFWMKAFLLSMCCEYFFQSVTCFSFSSWCLLQSKCYLST